jgi:hypothetical protein
MIFFQFLFFEITKMWEFITMMIIISKLLGSFLMQYTIIPKWIQNIIYYLFYFWILEIYFIICVEIMIKSKVQLLSLNYKHSTLKLKTEII